MYKVYKKISENITSPNILKDNSGKPILFYHGTPNHIKKFDLDFTKSDGSFGKGFYFTPSNLRAEFFAKHSKNNNEESSPNIIPVHIKMENPLVYYEIPINKIDYNKVLDHGYDGIIYENKGEVVEVIVYNHDQIISAITGKILENNNVNLKSIANDLSNKLHCDRHGNWFADRRKEFPDRVFKRINESKGFLELEFVCHNSLYKDSTPLNNQKELYKDLLHLSKDIEIFPYIQDFSEKGEVQKSLAVIILDKNKNEEYKKIILALAKKHNVELDLIDYVSDSILNDRLRFHSPKE